MISCCLSNPEAQWPVTPRQGQSRGARPAYRVAWVPCTGRREGESAERELLSAVGKAAPVKRATQMGDSLWAARRAPRKLREGKGSGAGRRAPGQGPGLGPRFGGARALGRRAHTS